MFYPFSLESQTTPMCTSVVSTSSSSTSEFHKTRCDMHSYAVCTCNVTYARLQNCMAALMTLVFYTFGTCGLQINLFCCVPAHVDQHSRKYLTYMLKVVMATKAFSPLMMLRLCFLRWHQYRGIYRGIWHNRTTSNFICRCSLITVVVHVGVCILKNIQVHTYACMYMWLLYYMYVILTYRCQTNHYWTNYHEKERWF